MVVYHTPIHKSRKDLLSSDNNMEIPVSLFIPTLCITTTVLFIMEQSIKQILLATARFTEYPVTTIRRTSIEIFQNSVLISILCSVTYAQCGSESPTSEHPFCQYLRLYETQYNISNRVCKKRCYLLCLHVNE